MHHAFKTAAFFVGLTISIAPAAAQDGTAEGIHVPHTKIWVETAKVSEHFSASSIWVQAFPDKECVIVTRVEQETMRKSDNLRVGDCLLYLDGFSVTDVEWLSRRMTNKSKEAVPSNGILKVAREGEEWEYPAYLITEEKK